jgi:REP element-mobilizing transposase RayT
MARRARQLAFRFRTWGGRRPGSGRPPSGERAGVSHLRRPVLSRRHPLHVTLRVVPGLSSLRDGAVFFAVRAALRAGKERFGFRLVHFSVQGDHLHLLAEAEGREALSRGLQGLGVRVARAVNRRLERHGRVFADRYHARSLRTPREARFALLYVLMNARKHGRGIRQLPPGFGDFCSSAAWFVGWGRPRELVFGIGSRPFDTFADAPVVPPQTWLLRVGAARAGPLDPDDAPLSAPPRRLRAQRSPAWRLRPHP